ncbi:hypothetical protein BCF11_5208 [Collimonas sp. PA-H2]|nr:hypothetical protein BCF11_5208 [Collimonas sp. PA-H2]
MSNVITADTYVLRDWNADWSQNRRTKIIT